jgi:hypothetical protein
MLNNHDAGVSVKALVPRAQAALSTDGLAVVADQLARAEPLDDLAGDVSAVASPDDGRIVAGFERGDVWIGSLRG